MSNLKKIEISGAAFGILFGTLLHFLYDWTKVEWIGLFSAVNESPWEHMKLLFFPVLIFLVVEWSYYQDKRRLLLAKTYQVVFSIVLTLAVFYTYTGVFGFENVWIDIASFIFSMSAGYFISYRILSSKRKVILPAWVYALILVFMVVFFWLATFVPPTLPLFLDKNTGHYGLEK